MCFEINPLRSVAAQSLETPRTHNLQPRASLSHIAIAAAAGDVVLKDTYERCIKPEGAYNGHKLHKGDVLDLQVCSTVGDK